MKKYFTLIELIVVIVVLGILAAIVIPNVSSFKEEAIRSEIASNIKNLQTASDRFSLESNGQKPSILNPTVENPQRVSNKLIYPKYISKKESDRGFYWVDHRGEVWGSTVEAPSRIHISGEKISWEAVPNAKSYQIYGAKDVELSGSVDGKTYKYDSLATVSNTKGTLILHQEIPNAENYEYLLVSTVDKYGFSSVPTGEGYYGYSQTDDAMSLFPIFDEGTFYLTTNAKDLATWDAIVSKELKPEGTQINYSFATSDDGKTFTSYTPNIEDLPKSQYMKVKIEMIGSNGELPTLKSLRVKFHLDEEVETTVEGPIEVPTGGFEQVIQTPEPEFFEDVIIVGSEAEYDVYYQSSEDGVNYSPPTFYPEELPQGEYIKVIIDTEESFDVEKIIVIQTPNDPNVAPVQEESFNNGNLPEATVPPTEPPTEEVQDDWEVTSEFEVIEDASSVGDWTSVEKIDSQPTGTEIDYKYYTSNDDATWAGPYAKVEDAPDSRYFKVAMEFKRLKGVNEVARIQEMTINYVSNGKNRSTSYKQDGKGGLEGDYDYISTYPVGPSPDGIVNVTTSGNQSQPALDGIGQSVFYSSGQKIERYDVSTGLRTLVTNLGHATSMPTISDNGERFLFRDDRADSYGDIYMKDLTNGEIVAIDTTNAPVYPSSMNSMGISSDGSTVYYNTQSSDPNDRVIRHLATNRTTVVKPKSGTLQLSPDGKVAYYIDLSNRVVSHDLELNVMSTGVTLPLTMGSIPRFSKDGKYIVSKEGNRQLDRINAVTGNRVSVKTTSYPEGNIEDFSYSNNGDVIAYKFYDGKNHTIEGIRMSTGEKFKLPTYGDSPKMSADGLSMTWMEGMNVRFSTIETLINLSK